MGTKRYGPHVPELWTATEAVCPDATIKNIHHALTRDLQLYQRINVVIVMASSVATQKMKDKDDDALISAVEDLADLIGDVARECARCAVLVAQVPP